MRIKTRVAISECRPQPLNFRNQNFEPEGPGSRSCLTESLSSVAKKLSPKSRSWLLASLRAAPPMALSQKPPRHASDTEATVGSRDGKAAVGEKCATGLSY